MTTATKTRMKHGSYSTYSNKACRCKKCVAAHTEYVKAYRATPTGRAAAVRANKTYRERMREAALWAYENGFENSF